jgi:glycosyltransferase involved in cell wall biosynthesis
MKKHLVLEKRLVSIVTPSYNQSRFIEETILSVKNQDYPNIEHIIVDGGSTDGTIGILKKYPHLSWVSEPDKGQADALNKGFRMAKGEVVAWLNSDDTYLQDTVKSICLQFAHSDVEMVFGDCNQINHNGRVIGVIKGYSFDLTHLIPRNCIPQPTVFFKRELIRRVGSLDTRYHHAFDYDYWIRIGLSGCKIEYLPKTLANFRIHKDSKTSREMEIQKREEIDVTRRYARLIGSRSGVVVKDLEELKKEKTEMVLIYGTGRAGEILHSVLLENGFEVLGFMDSAEEKWRKNFLDKRIFSFEEAKETGYDAILIGSQFIKEIKNTLEDNGITENIIVPIIL